MPQGYAAGLREAANVATVTSKPALSHLRDQVGQGLGDFLRRQRPVLLGASEELLPGLEALSRLLAGGKRLRPAFCYWGWRGAGGPDCPQILAAAAALDLLHAGALVHDDVMDGSDTRRGQPSLHRQFADRHAARRWHGSAQAFGASAAILLGDLLLSWTDQMYQASGLPPEALRCGQPVLDLMRTEVMAGQYLDLLGQAAGDGTVESALRVVEYKTAKYTIERPLQLGAALAHGAALAGDTALPHDAALPGDAALPYDAALAHGAALADDTALTHGQALAADTTSAIAAAYAAYGLPLGVAFQLRDDILGLFGDPAQTGKPAGDDIREGKRTVLLAITGARASAAQAAIIGRRLGDPQLDEAGVAEVRAVITGTGALAECELMIDRHVAEALSALDAAPIADEAKTALAELAVTATARRG
jgi:geranylgeranyl diphosphate synthase type I